ncbi:hypothetical protein DH2020_028705 [Rehmannia glutinosa]|uniref:SPX domain-containing protein n=1 Tax=Rehmannia glutinosa TaxID=99300 RepID=A0ABR0VQQ3_REHGL
MLYFFGGVEGVIAVIHREDLPHYSWHKILTSFGILGNDGMACQAQLNLSALQLSVVTKMVAFGKKLKERQIQEWQGYYINYKLMKKKVKQYGNQIENGALDRRHVLKDFSRMLDHQIEKIVLFMLEQQGLIASRIAQLNEQQEALQEEPDISKISDLREAYRAVGQDLLKLLFFVEMNAIGLRKILKKFDKRFGYKFTDYYVKTRANHPYSQLQQVFKHVGLGAVVGAISRNLADLQDRQGSYLSIYDQPALPLQINPLDKFPRLLGQHALIMHEELPSPVDDHAEEERYHFMSLLLNLANTFLYMVNTYIIVPTADDYSMSLGAAATVFWVLPEQLTGVILATVCHLKPGCRLAGFVSASALGMACGPALAGLLQIRFKIFNITFSQDTLPGWVMAVAWLFYLIWLWISFREPVRETEENVVPQESSAAQNDKLEKGLAQPLLTSTEHEQDDDGDQECDESEEAPEESRRPANSLGEAYRLLTPSVKCYETSLMSTGCKA